MEGENEDVWTDGEDEPTDDLRYNGKGKTNSYMNWEHAEDSFEANNHNISTVRSKIRNTNEQSKTKAKTIDLNRTAHLQFQALNLRHDADVHSRPGGIWRKIAS